MRSSLRNDAKRGHNIIMRNNTNDKDNLMYNIMQLVIFIVMLMLIILRCINFKAEQNSLIWIINYFGMSIAFTNLFINKCFSLKKKQDKKYKPFVGFTICMIFLISLLIIPVYKSQSNENSRFVNDLITLLALFFSLSHTTWNFFLNLIVKIL